MSSSTAQQRKTDVTILIGDFNAKISMDNNGHDEVVETHGVGDMNEKGTICADTCALNSIVIGGSIFTQKV